MAAQSPKRIVRVVAVVLAASFSAIILWQAYIHVGYDYYMPNVPEPETGRVHRIIVNHGDLRYVTQQELTRARFVLDTLFWWEYPIFFALGLLVVYCKPFEK